jgi:branched-subunit amino acid aminotransferase/4-amino-4-deoxychorismate lyase
MNRQPIPPDSPAARYGIGLFETLHLTGGRAVLAHEHIARMQRSARELGFASPAGSDLEDLIAAALADERAESALRIDWIATGDDLESIESWTLSSSLRPIPEVTLRRREGAHVILLDHSAARSLPRHKMIAHSAAFLALREAVERGANEALFTDCSGRILEGTSTNVFAVPGTTLITAPVKAGILPGVVRQWVLTQAPLMGFSVEKRPPTREELLAGAFVTGSLTTLAPVVTVDGVEAEDRGEIFHELRRLYRETFMGS